VSADRTRPDVNEVDLIDGLMTDLTRRTGGYPGPTPAGWAYLAAEAARGLNHASNRPVSYAWPSDVDSVLGHLQTLAQRLPQALDQARRWLAAAHKAGRLGDDRSGQDARSTAYLAAMKLLAAAKAANDLADALRFTREQTSHLTGADPAPDPRGDALRSDGQDSPVTARISPDCTAGKCGACSGDAWDFAKDHRVDCEHDCHTREGARRG